MPAPEIKRRSTSSAARWKPPDGDVTRSLQGFAGN
jgi:hypothetical protein